MKQSTIDGTASGSAVEIISKIKKRWFLPVTWYEICPIFARFELILKVFLFNSSNAAVCYAWYCSKNPVKGNPILQYKIFRHHQLLPVDAQQRLQFAIKFLPRMDVDDALSSKILRGYAAHFHLKGILNTPNCRIRTSEHQIFLKKDPSTF